MVHYYKQLSIAISRSVEYFPVEEKILKVWFILGTPFNFTSDNYNFHLIAKICILCFLFYLDWYSLALFYQNQCSYSLLIPVFRIWHVPRNEIKYMSLYWRNWFLEINQTWLQIYLTTVWQGQTGIVDHHCWIFL